MSVSDDLVDGWRERTRSASREVAGSRSRRGRRQEAVRDGAERLRQGLTFAASLAGLSADQRGRQMRDGHSASTAGTALARVGFRCRALAASAPRRVRRARSCVLSGATAASGSLLELQRRTPGSARTISERHAGDQRRERRQPDERGQECFARTHKISLILLCTPRQEIARLIVFFFEWLAISPAGDSACRPKGISPAGAR